MLKTAPSDLVALMSYRHGVPGTGHDMHGFYDAISSEWSGLEASAFVGVPSPYCTSSMVPGSTILTPISLPDSSYRPSPALNHQSHDYQYSLNDHIPPAQGLGITAPFPSNFPRTSAPQAGYLLAQEELKYTMTEPSSTFSPPPPPIQPPPAKRVKRNPPPTKMPPRDNHQAKILPDPESMRRMEHDRQHHQEYPQSPLAPRRPAAGRGRRDPEAENQDAYVEALRERDLSWKVIREMFQDRFHQDVTEARLQMRLSRRRKERLARWHENDIKLLLCAHGLWQSEKYRFISEKMKELGAVKMYTPEQCKDQLRHLETSQRHRDVRRISPSAKLLLDPPQTAPSIPQKREAPSSPLGKIEGEREDRG